MTGPGRRWLAPLAFAAALLVSSTSAFASGRVALVIGNGGYEKLSRLGNPVGDAEAVAGMLRANGFDVIEATDLTRADFLDSLDGFRAKASGADVAVVYYAGHGMEVDGRDVIAPVDMEVACDSRELKRSVPLSALFEAADGAATKVMLLDACRSDPFPACAKRGAAEEGGFRGLTRVSSSGATLIASATLSGSVAADGAPGSHSPFTSALLQRFGGSPAVPIRDLLDQVAEDVRLATDGAQIPEVTSRGGAPKVCLSPDGCEGNAVIAMASPPAAVPARLVMNVPPKLIAAPPEHPVGSNFRDCSDCPEMTVVPAGRFLMGSPESEAGREVSEGPQVEVSIGRPFAVSKTEITFDQYETCRLEGGCSGERPRDAGWGRGSRPVIYVNFAAAQAYAAWLSASTGARYRLLSEAEWEYAARAGTTTAYSTGSVLAKSAANVDFSQSGDVTLAASYAGRTLEVGSYPPNPFGLSDTMGNVAEWVADCWSPDHSGAPTDGSARGGDCSRRVVKGGAWYFEPSTARSAARASYPVDKALNVIGFRVAREIEGGAPAAPAAAESASTEAPQTPQATGVAFAPVFDPAAAIADATRAPSEEVTGTDVPPDAAAPLPLPKAGRANLKPKHQPKTLDNFVDRLPDASAVPRALKRLFN